jgi:hypothetical protein
MALFGIVAWRPKEPVEFSNVRFRTSGTARKAAVVLRVGPLTDRISTSIVMPVVTQLRLPY